MQQVARLRRKHRFKTAFFLVSICFSFSVALRLLHVVYVYNLSILNTLIISQTLQQGFFKIIRMKLSLIPNGEDRAGTI